MGLLKFKTRRALMMIHPDAGPLYSDMQLFPRWYQEVRRWNLFLSLAWRKYEVEGSRIDLRTA